MCDPVIKESWDHSDMVCKGKNKTKQIINYVVDNTLQAQNEPWNNLTKHNFGIKITLTATSTSWLTHYITNMTEKMDKLRIFIFYLGVSPIGLRVLWAWTAEYPSITLMFNVWAQRKPYTNGNEVGIEI